MEQGGYVVQDPSGTQNLSPFNSTSASGMTLTPRPAGDVLLSFHTHPNIGVDPVTGLVWNPGPSQADFLTFATHPELAPHFVVAQPGVYQIADPFGGKFLFPDRVRVLGGP